MSDYTLTITVDAPVDETERKVREALSDEGFGVLTEIDMQAKLIEKVGEDVGPYKILGACNPPLAHRAVQADPDIGALLPCNVVVRANPAGGTDVVAADPEAMLGIAEGTGLSEVASEARARLERALKAVTA